MKVFGAIVTLLSLILLSNGQHSLTFLELNCGPVPLKFGPRILDGQTTSILEHPWMAFVSSTTECDPPTSFGPCKVMCGGSLITNRFVLSAAHCSFNQYTTIKLGELEWQESTTNGIEVPAVEKISHPHYDHNPNHPKNDIALYKLARTVTYTRFIRPICLPTNFNPLATTKYLTATGWGKTENGAMSNELKKGTVRQLDRSTCYSTYGVDVDMSQICAGGSRASTCSGDSGGPITGFFRTEGSYIVVQLGIISYGARNCRSASVYTNVMHYMDWITNVVQRTEVQNTPAPTRRSNNYHRQTTRAPFRWTTTKTTATTALPPTPPPSSALDFIKLGFKWFITIVI